MMLHVTTGIMAWHYNKNTELEKESLRVVQELPTARVAGRYGKIYQRKSMWRYHNINSNRKSTSRASALVGRFLLRLSREQRSSGSSVYAMDVRGLF